MSVFRSMDRGSWIVKRRVLGIRVRRATGIEDLARARELEQVLIKLGKHGLRDLVVAFHRGEVSGAELLASVERYGLTYQLTVESTVRLRRAMYDWLTTVDLAEKTRKEYRYNLGALVGKLPPIDREPTAVEAKALARGPVQEKLADLLSKYARRARPSMFVQVKAAAQSWVCDNVPGGGQSALWRSLAAIKGPRRPPRNVELGLSPERAREAAELLAAAYDATTGQVWWTLCCTGMEPKECWREKGWKAESGRLQVCGTKTKQGFRVRWVPLIVTPVRPNVAIKTFRKRLTVVGKAMGLKLPLTPYVARRTFAHFLELAQKQEGGPLDSQCDLLMGQSPKTDRAKYREHDIVPYLPAIGAALRKVIGTDPVYMKAMA